MLEFFMVKKQTEDNNWLRSNADKEVENAGSKDRHAVFGKGLKAQMKAKKKELSKVKEEENDQQEEEKSEKPKYDLMVDTFKEEELGSGHDLNEVDLFMNEQGKSLMT